MKIIQSFKISCLIILLLILSNNLWGQCYALESLLKEIPTIKGFCPTENCLKARANRHWYIFPDKSTMLTEVKDSIELKYDEENRVIEFIDYIVLYFIHKQRPPHLHANPIINLDTAVPLHFASPLKSVLINHFQYSKYI